MRIGFKRNIDQINSILIENLNKGETYLNSYAKLNAVLPMSRKTFDRYWLKANELYKTQSTELLNEILSNGKKNKLRILRQLVVSEDLIIKSCLLLMTDARAANRDKVNAMKLICEIKGYKAPIQNNISFVNPTPVFGFNPLLQQGKTIDVQHTEIIE